VNHSLQAATDRWREDLVQLGFSDDGAQLCGPVTWTRPGDSPATARVQVTLTPDFPFAPPKVVVLDPGSVFEATFHVDRDGVLCLWEDDWSVDDAPWLDPGAFLARIAGWMQETAAGWPDDDVCDLERYLVHDRQTFILYDADTLIPDVLLRTTQGPTPGTVTITEERRQLRDTFGKRRRRKDNRLAWVADIGAVVRPLRSWNDVGTALGPRCTAVSRLISFGVVSFVVLRYARGDTPGVLVLRVSHTSTGIEVAACENADTSPATRALRAGPAPFRLVDLRIAVVGCGAIGSFTADLLFRSGIRHITLADGERLRPGNVVRHLGGLDHVGRPKPDAVRACLRRVDPDVSHVRTRGSLVDLDDATALVREHHVVLDATGSARASSLLATAAEQVGRGSGHAVVSVCVQRDGDVLRVDRMPVRRGEIHLPPLSPRESTISQRERGCGAPVSPTPPGAVTAAAELAFRSVLDEATRECALPATVVEVRASQPEPPFHHVGRITSADHVRAAAS
jgi:hypothetical protein